jgi:hypothetical protein
VKITIAPAGASEIATFGGYVYESRYDFYVYERAGFRRTGEHVRTFARWGEVPFVEMELVR